MGVGVHTIRDRLVIISRRCAARQLFQRGGHLASTLNDSAFPDNDFRGLDITHDSTGGGDFNGCVCPDRPADPATYDDVVCRDLEIERGGWLDEDVAAGGEGFAGMGTDDPQVLERDPFVTMGTEDGERPGGDSHHAAAIAASHDPCVCAGFHRATLPHPVGFRFSRMEIQYPLMPVTETFSTEAFYGSCFLLTR